MSKPNPWDDNAINIYSHGTPAAQVEPWFRGVSFSRWQGADLARQATEHRRALAMKPEDAPLSKKAVATKRDSYGWKSA